MKRTVVRSVARLLVALLLLQPLLGGLGTLGRASAAQSSTVTEVNNAANEENLLAALTQAEDLTLPDHFNAWSAADKTDAAMAIKSFIQPNDQNKYETVAQIQYVLNLLGALYASREDVSVAGISGKINQVIALSSNLAALFPNSEDVGYMQESIDRIAALSPADRQIFDIYVQNEYVKSGVEEPRSPFMIAMMIFESEGQVPEFSQPESDEDMLYVLMSLLQYADDLSSFQEAYPDAPVAAMGLDFDKAVKVLGGDLEADETTIQNWLTLAQWLIDQRPEGGYASIAAIQSAFDSFFSPLRAVNDAQNEQEALEALINPELGLKLPEGFEGWSTAVKLSWAKSIISISFGGPDNNPTEVKHFTYKNVEQVQYISDLVARPIVLLDDRSLPTVTATIDAVFEHVANFDTVFPEIEGAEMFAQLAGAYTALTPLEKSIYAYSIYLALTSLPVPQEGQEVDNVAGGLFAVLLMSIGNYPGVNSASTTTQMSDALKRFREIQMMAEAIQQEHPEIEEWNLDLSKINDPEFPEETLAALSDWMLDKRPEGGYADLKSVQDAFDEFFMPAAPAVTADDDADKLIGATAELEYSTDNGATWTAYDPDHAPVFSGTVTVLVRVKASGNMSAGKTASVSFTQSYVYIPPMNNNTETLYVDVQGSNGTGLARTPVTRTTDASGKVTDTVTLSGDIAKEAVDKAKAQSGSTVRIVLPDSGDKVSEVSVNIPQAALTQINNAQMNLELSTADGVVTIPVASLSGFGQDLYFRLVPVKSEDGRVQIETRAKQETAIKEYVQDESIKIYGRPMEIETNLQSKEAVLFMPLKDGLPADTTERNRILSHLGVYAEHSDGTKELIQGKVVTVNNVTGIQFTVKKFSTFALVYLDGLNDAQNQTPSAHTPYINGFGKDFRPEAFVTRGQMAAMLARNLPDTTVPADKTAGSDVRAGHWAHDEILKAKSAGIMGGITEDTFDPEGAVTRAQMAAIAARWLQKGPTPSQVTGIPESTAGYGDVPAGHWAADAISYVSAQGIMTGYAGQTFKPDQKLTRAEAVKVLNRLFDRGPLNGSTALTFADVPAAHWAYADIEEAATNHTFTVDAQGAEQIAAP